MTARWFVWPSARRAVCAWMLAAAAVCAPVVAASEAAEQTWAELKPDVFGSVDLLDGSERFSMDVPARAVDPARVPISIRARDGVELHADVLTIIVDENPAPVVATVQFGPAIGSLDFSTRIRVNAYSHVRAVVRTTDGAYYMVSKFVKASGGCSAPPASDPGGRAASGRAAIGNMEFALLDAPDGKGGESRARVQVRHPNASGLQRDQLTHHFTPAHFIHRMQVRRGSALVMQLEAGISVSEDPAFEFPLNVEGSQRLSVRAVDTDGVVFAQSFSLSDALAAARDGVRQPL